MRLSIFAHLLAAVAFCGFAAGQAPTLLTTDANIPIERVNRLTSPAQGQFAPAGESFAIMWQLPTPGTVSLYLFRGAPPNAQQLYPIVEKTPNTGIFVWTPSAALITEGTQYSMELIDDSTGQRQWSGPFGVSPSASFPSAVGDIAAAPGNPAVAVGAGLPNGGVAAAGAQPGAVATGAAVAGGANGLQSSSVSGTAALFPSPISSSASWSFASNFSTTTMVSTSLLPAAATATSSAPASPSHSANSSSLNTAASQGGTGSADGGSDSGLSTGAKAGIGVGVPLAVLAVAGLAYLAYRFAHNEGWPGSSASPTRGMSETDGEHKRLALVISTGGGDLEADQDLWEVRTV